MPARRTTLILALLLAITFLASLPAQAQATPTFSNVEVDLWPEYDRQEVLVILRISLAADTSLPADLTIRIPANGELNAVAVRGADGNLVSITNQRQVSGEWALVSFTATMPELQLEYYDPSITKQEAARNYEYRWPADYAVNMLSIQVQQPIDATQMVISPNLGAGTSGQDGLMYYTAQIGAMPAGQEFKINLGYQKSSDRLSVENLQVQPASPAATSSTIWGQITPYLPWILGIFGVALIGGGGLWYWQSSRPTSKAHQARQRHKPTVARQEPAEESGTIYCHNCGKRAGPGDRFCRTCGAKLRSE